MRSGVLIAEIRMSNFWGRTLGDWTDPLPYCLLQYACLVQLSKNKFLLFSILSPSMLRGVRNGR
jgi:hypothetical protein